MGRRVLAPVWEEPVIFNESLQHFFQHRVLILFEILGKSSVATPTSANHFQ